MPHHLIAFESPAADDTHVIDPLDLAWLAVHGRNLAAHHAGREAAAQAAVTGTGVTNPYRGLDEQYWFNEGRYGRPFSPITDHTALQAVVSRQSASV